MAERLFKFLSAGSVGRFSGFCWPAPVDRGPSEWVTAEGQLEPCVSGIHVCRPGDLAYWLDDELWEVEVGGRRIEHFEKLVVERARLASRVDAWPHPLAAELADDCLRSLWRLTVRELELSGDPDAPALAEVDEGEAAGRARSLADNRPPARTAAAARLLGLLADAGSFVADVDALGPALAGRYVSYISAYAADRATPEPGKRLPPGVTPFALERRRQAELLLRALGAELPT